MFTSDNRKAAIYLAVSIAVMIFGAIYEHFSFGVYSNYMIYAFAIPLLGGVLPYTVKPAIIGRRKIDLNGLYHMGIATLTIGSIMKGVLDIYGTTNRLLMIYPVAGAILIITALARSGIFARKTSLAQTAEQMH